MRSSSAGRGARTRCTRATSAGRTGSIKKTHIAMTEQAKKLDQALLAGLARRGFRLDFGDDGAGWQFKYLTRGGGYYFNVGCSDLIVKGEVDLIQVFRYRRLRRRGSADAHW